MKLVGVSFALIVGVAADFQPARFLRGDAPLPAPQAVGWEQAVLRLRVSDLGGVDRIEPLAGTEPLTSALRGMVSQWRFEPAMQDGQAEASDVLVAAVYRPPTLYNVPPFRGGAIRLATRADIPVPAAVSAPAFPPKVIGDGVVVVEVLVGLKGDVRSAAVVHSTGSGFDASAVQAALKWRFRPAARPLRRSPTYVYLVFGFRQPVIRTPAVP